MAIDRKYGVIWRSPLEGAQWGDLRKGDDAPLASIDLRVEIPGVDTLTAEDVLRLEGGLRQIVDRVLQDAKAGLL